MTQPNLKITYEYAESPAVPHIEITVDGKQVFAESVVIEMTTAGTKAVITVYDLGITFSGPADVVHKTKNDEGEWV